MDPGLQNYFCLPDWLPTLAGTSSAELCLMDWRISTLIHITGDSNLHPGLGTTTQYHVSIDFFFFFFDGGYGYWHDTVILLSTLLSSGENISAQDSNRNKFVKREEKKNFIRQRLQV